jgi:hypothetical protein
MNTLGADVTFLQDNVSLLFEQKLSDPLSVIFDLHIANHLDDRECFLLTIVDNVHQFISRRKLVETKSNFEKSNLVFILSNWVQAFNQWLQTQCFNISNYERYSSSRMIMSEQLLFLFYSTNFDWQSLEWCFSVYSNSPQVEQQFSYFFPL